VKRVVFFSVVVALFAPLLGAAPSFAVDQPLWTAPRAAALLQAIRGAADHGLDPDWYGIAALEKAAAAGNEQALSDAFVAYASDLSTGRVNANRVDKEIDIQQRTVSRAELLKVAADAPDFAAYLDSLAPKGDYAALQKALAALRQQRASVSYTPLPGGELLKPGMTDARVPVLRKRLGELGLSVPAVNGVAELYDEPLAVVVKT